MNNPSTGVDVYGYLYAASGVGQHTRLLIRALESANVPYGAHPYMKTTSPQTVPFPVPEVDGRFSISIIGVNADQSATFFEDHNLEDAHYRIGLWAWETEDFPRSMVREAERFDEIWANSGFSASAIARKVDKPVFPFPLPIEEPALTPITRGDVGLDDRFLFLFCFDYDSVFKRKNPIAVVRAFRTAFGTNEPKAQLLIKAMNGQRHDAERQELASEIAETPGVTYIEKNLPIEEQHGLVNLCDSYVSLHRSEGFGLTLAEAMALGKPVVATAYSGNLDFMDHGTAELIGYRYEKVGPGALPYAQTSRWAEPDIYHAARAMRRLADNPLYARELGGRAKRHVLEGHGLTQRGRWISGRLRQIERSLASGS